MNAFTPSAVPCTPGSRTADRPSAVGWRRWALLRLAFLAVTLLLPVIVAPRLLDIAMPVAASPWHAAFVAARNLAVVVLMLASYRLSVRVLERRDAAEIDFRPGGFVAGVGIGTALISVVYMLLYLHGDVTFSAGNGQDGLAFAAIGTLGAALVEELVLRAILFRIAEQVVGTTAAIAFSAIVFGLMHGMNHGATVTSTLAVALESGVLLALAYVLTRNLWLAVGIHLGWNFFEGSVYGAAVSGTSATHTAYSSLLAGPAMLTGGEFGPEASILSVLACLAASAVILAVARRRGNWIGLKFQLKL